MRLIPIAGWLTICLERRVICILVRTEMTPVLQELNTSQIHPKGLTKCIDYWTYRNTMPCLFRLISRGCKRNSECQDNLSENLQSCRPGEIGAVCNFCCHGSYCNSVEWLNSGKNSKFITKSNFFATNNVKSNTLCVGRDLDFPFMLA